jgi:SAM-dependent methyltransferase
MRPNRKYSNYRQTNSNLEYAGTEELIDSERGLVRYNSDVVKKIATGLGLNRKSEIEISILEFGAGTGTLAQLFESIYTIKPICIEIAPALQKILKSKGFETIDSLSKLEKTYMYIYTSNVLEHIDDDLAYLKAIRNCLDKDGKLAIYVPAIPFLFSEFDRRVGHYRRYSKGELVSKVQKAGFKIEECYYNDSIGVLASLVLKIVGYKNRVGLGSKISLNFYDNFVYPISKVLDKLIFKRYLGKNLLLIASNDLL